MQNYKTGDSQRFERIDEDIESTNMFAEHETETIGSTTILFYRADDGHKICMQDQESKVQALYEATGVAWYYIIDMINKQFKLPRTKFGFTGLRDSVGGYVEAGLPNIEGTILSRSLSSDYPGAVTHGTGAFSFSKKTGVSSSQITITNTSGAADTISFEASRSSSVYGNSNTVQPEATQMYLYFYVGNFERDAIEQTAGLNAEMFNDKADVSLLENKANTDLSNIPSAYDYVVKTYKSGTTWYRKYKSGWIEQGGKQTGNASLNLGSAGTIGTITLPVEMKDTNYYANAHDTTYCMLGNVEKTKTTVKFQFMPYETNRSLTTVFWEVKGYAA